MKKLLLSAFLAATLFSCKKEAEKSENTAVIDSISNKSPESVPAAVSLKVLNSQQTTDFLQTKNDTLYVTNFFATWCGPCVREIPHFKDKISELKDQPVKITFISLDTKEVWASEVPVFVDKLGIRNNTILLDGSQLDEKFFKNNFEKWDGGAIPFTYMRKGDKTDEYLGMMTPELLNSKIDSFLK
ncbi:TlpA family protein disulfide reductase [Chryseobacterium chendengshani]|uniref:TlpA family protein disulfide reductase n=1 Tax=unclassified Chryseobacterium TaxID=2593645 RepID=UPI001C641C2E|nr:MULTISPECIES: TlpA disulfide reductase family protein [unclassified Chryseobacterium]MBW7674466.1 TlpA family protein disulfide reductase [Chryseobacterium sp. LJ756]MBW8522742.1 TlpA family protein disulfide reductase [Chryseobacterium sp. LJ668]QYK16276.1 TlpA family protein disulfide reductase [Chryseobacterium sp. LJ668]